MAIQSKSDMWELSNHDCHGPRIDPLGADDDVRHRAARWLLARNVDRKVICSEHGPSFSIKPIGVQRLGSISRRHAHSNMANVAFIREVLIANDDVYSFHPYSDLRI